MTPLPSARSLISSCPGSLFELRDVDPDSRASVRRLMRSATPNANNRAANDRAAEATEWYDPVNEAWGRSQEEGQRANDEAWRAYKRAEKKAMRAAEDSYDEVHDAHHEVEDASCVLDDRC